MPVTAERRSASLKPVSLRVESTGFSAGGTLPVRFTADGDNVSPPIAWGEPPTGTQSFALILEDPDAPSGTFIHWLAWDIKVGTRELDENIPPNDEVSGMRQGQNGFGRRGYGGPAPPPGGPHRYVFRIFALDYRPELRSGATRSQLDRAMRGHVLAEGHVIGTYGR